MAQVRYCLDADISVLRNKRLAVLGYGSQGHAHALNLKESGLDVTVGLRPGSPSIRTAKAAGLRVTGVEEACAQADVIVVLVPDTSQPSVYQDTIAPCLRPGNTLIFAHGFNIRHQTIVPPTGVDVILVAPQSSGHRVRESFVDGDGMPAVVAVYQDATGAADTLAMSYAKALGCTRAGVWTTTFANEEETDVFAEPALLCGSRNPLVQAAERRW